MEPHRILATVLPLCIPIVVFAISTRSSLSDVREAFKNRIALLRLCATTFIGIPIIAVIVTKLLTPIWLVKGIILVGAIAPGDPFMVLEAEHKKGSVPLAQALTLVFTVAMPVMLFVWSPVLDWVFAGEMHVYSMGAFIKVAVIVVPFVLGGVLLRTFAPKFTDAIQKPLHWIALAAYILLGVVVLVVSIRSIAVYTFFSALAVCIITTLSLLAGYFGSGYKTERGRRTAALAATLGNTIVVLYVAIDTYHFPATEVGGVIAATVVIRVLTVMLWNALAKRSQAVAAGEAG